MEEYLCLLFRLYNVARPVYLPVAYRDVAVAHHLACLRRRLCAHPLHDYCLEPALKQVLNLQSENVIERCTLFYEANPRQKVKQPLFLLCPGLCRKCKQRACLVPDPCHLCLGLPELALVPQAVRAHDIKFSVKLVRGPYSPWTMEQFLLLSRISHS